MIDLSKCSAASRLMHTVDANPGKSWSKESDVAIDAPPDFNINPRPGFPDGANDYDNASTRILSAFSAEDKTWVPEPGVRKSDDDKGGP